MAKIGYARVSSKEQNLDRQMDALQDVSKVFYDKLSGQDTKRPQLLAMLDYIGGGDIVVVTELERLGRNNKDLTEVMGVIQQKGLSDTEVAKVTGINRITFKRYREKFQIEVSYNETTLSAFAFLHQVLQFLML